MTRSNSTLRWWLLAVGVLFAGLAVVVAASVDGDTAGDVAAVEASLTPSPTVEAIDRAADSPVEQPQTPSPNPVRALDQLHLHTGGPDPVGLAIEALGVDAPILPYGVDASTGQMDVPHNVRDVAWYRHGPRPGEAGSAVLAAHVDLRDHGPGVFHRLRDLHAGAFITVRFDDGTSSDFVVVARAVYVKEELPLDVIFSREGEPVLTLVTCGGAFSRSERRYDSNVVVYAVPVEAGLEGVPS